MLKLYSFGPGANSLKPMLTLFEKFTLESSNTTPTGSPRSTRADRFRRWKIRDRSSPKAR